MVLWAITQSILFILARDCKVQLQWQYSSPLISNYTSELHSSDISIPHQHLMQKNTLQKFEPMQWYHVLNGSLIKTICYSIKDQSKLLCLKQYIVETIISENQRKQAKVNLFISTPTQPCPISPGTSALWDGFKADSHFIKNNSVGPHQSHFSAKVGCHH